MSNKKEHEWARFTSKIRRANKEKTKNQIKFLHYQILVKKTQSLFNFIIQTKQNRLKFPATTTTFERRFDVFLLEIDHFSFSNDITNERRELHRKSNENFESNVNFEKTRRWDVTNESIFFSKLKNSLDELNELLNEILFSSAFFFVFCRFHIDVILIAERLEIKRHVERFSFEDISIFFEDLVKFFLTCRLRFVVFDIVIIINFIIFIVFIIFIFIVVIFVIFVIVVIIVISFIIITWRRRRTFSIRRTQIKCLIRQKNNVDIKKWFFKISTNAYIVIVFVWII